MTMIKGLGIDLVELDRILWLWRRRGDRFADRILSPKERLASPAGMGPAAVRFLAGRFAAKEAVLKALGTGLARGILWREIEITNAPSGEPRVSLSGAAERLARRRRIGAVHITISHARTLACAAAVAERLEQRPPPKK